MTEPTRVQLAVDIGGTFTDVLLLDGQERFAKAKILSTPPNYGDAVLAGVRAVLEAVGRDPGDISTIFHGMTVATNAVLERKGSTPALVTTRGFRDILELARNRRPHMYDLRWEKPPPLAPRALRLEVDHRIGATGEVLSAPETAALDDLARQIGDADVESVAVCLINSYLVPEVERALITELRARCPEIMFTASVDVAPEPGEYERTSTAVVNAYVMPPVARYLDRLEADLQREGATAPLSVMQSSGGLVNSNHARREPVHLMESGPAAGVTATAVLSRALSLPSVIAFDMGGTTAKASLVEHGEPFEAPEFEVGAGMNSKRGLSVGAGYTVRTASLDIAEIGAGGGSVFWIDEGGAPRVGPHSAGASPGPACYGLGGTDPTLSDAAAVLGYLNPDAIAGGGQPLFVDRAEAAFAPVAARLGLSVRDAAYGAYRIAVSNMTSLVRAVTVERGRDPRASVLVAFGGAGPAYAAVMAAALGIETVIVPVTPGLFSAAGLLVSDPRHDDLRPYLGPQGSVERIAGEFEHVQKELLDRLRADGYDDRDITVERFVEMRYTGQQATMRVRVGDGALTADLWERVVDDFEAEHERTYGHRKSRAWVETVNLRVRGTYRSTPTAERLRLLGAADRVAPSVAESATRAAYFGPEAGVVDTPVLRRADLGAGAIAGPLIVEELDSTTVVPPGASAALDDFANLVIRTSSETAP